MRKILSVLILLSLALAACTPQPAAPVAEPTNIPPTTEPTPIPATPTEELVAEPTTAVMAEPTAAPSATATAEPTPEGSAVTYTIVSAESEASYEVGETFFDNNRFAVAIGVTSEISGTVLIDLENPSASTLGKIEVDLSKLKSDSNRRDDYIRQNALQSARFPIATFVPTAMSGLPETYTPGETLVFQVTGDLTVKETTQPVTFEVSVTLDGDTLTGSATTTVLMSQFGVGPITLAGILGTEDEVKVTLEFVARP